MHQSSDGPDQPSAPPAHAPVARILLVDDAEDVRRPTRRILEQSGFHVCDVESGAAAVSAFGADGATFDIVVTDIAMPEMNGIELVERLRTLRPGIPVLFISGYADRRTQVRSTTASEARFLAKPFNGAELLAALLGLLPSRRLDAPA